MHCSTDRSTDRSTRRSTRRSTNRLTHRPLRLVALGALALTSVLHIHGDARADVIVDQPESPENGFASQEFADFPAYTCSAFDDVTLTQGYDLTSLVVFGQNGVADGWMYNTDVRLRIYTEPSLAASPLATVSGVQVAGALTWDLTGITLGPGTYWISAQVVRPFEPGGQWYWNASGTTNGAHAMWHNPGGGFGLGGDPISTELLGATQWDMSMRLEGTPVPAPAVLAVLLAGGLAGGRSLSGGRARRHPRETR